MTFKPTRNFRINYDQIFKEAPLAANIYLLLCEIADEKGQVNISPEEIQLLLALRFNDPEEYAL